MGENLAAIVSPPHLGAKGKTDGQNRDPAGYLKLSRYLAIV